MKATQPHAGTAFYTDWRIRVKFKKWRHARIQLAYARELVQATQAYAGTACCTVWRTEWAYAS